jgi:hypothetical protein
MHRTRERLLFSNNDNIGSPSLDFDYSKVPQIDSRITWTRNTTATVVDVVEGKLNTCKANEARFTGRRVENLIPVSESLSIFSVVNTSTFASKSGNTITFAAGTTQADRAIAVFLTVSSILERYTLSAVLSGSGSVLLAILSGNGAFPITGLYTNVTLTSTPTRYAIVQSANSLLGANAGIQIRSNGTAATVNYINSQLENVTGQANQNPSEYVSVGVLSAPYHGLGVDQFSTTNGNTVIGNVVTEAPGTLLPVRRVENLIPGSNDFSNTSHWNVSSYTVASNYELAPTGNMTSLLTATAQYATLYPTTSNAVNLTLPIGTYVMSFYARRVSGTNPLLINGRLLNGSDLTIGTPSLTNSLRRYSYLFTVVSLLQWFRLFNDSATSGFGSISISDFQIENVTGQANQNPSEYVSVGVLSAPYYGAGVDGVKYFNTTNGNTVASNVVTEAAGTPLTGITLLAESTDIATFTGTNLSSWYNPSAGTFIITAKGSAFNAPYNLGALSLTYASLTNYALVIKDGNSYLYTAATIGSPTVFSGVSIPSTLYLVSAGTANISRFQYYPKALTPKQLARLL